MRTKEGLHSIELPDGNPPDGYEYRFLIPGYVKPYYRFTVWNLCSHKTELRKRNYRYIRNNRIGIWDDFFNQPIFFTDPSKIMEVFRYYGDREPSINNRFIPVEDLSFTLKMY